MYLHFIHIQYTWLENVVICFQQDCFACSCHLWPELFMHGNKKPKPMKVRRNRKRYECVPCPASSLMFSLVLIKVKKRLGVMFLQICKTLLNSLNLKILHVMRWLNLTSVGLVSESQNRKYLSMPSHIRNKLVRTNWKYTTSQTLAGKAVTISASLFWCKPWNGWSLWE